jgi:hypothetical protein
MCELGASWLSGRWHWRAASTGPHDASASRSPALSAGPCGIDLLLRTLRLSVLGRPAGVAAARGALTPRRLARPGQGSASRHCRLPAAGARWREPERR